MNLHERPKETLLIDKVFDMLQNIFSQELKKAVKIYQKTSEAKNCPNEYYFNRGFMAWFLLEYELKNLLTPMEIAFSFPLSYFSNEDKIIIKNFLQYIESLFEVKKISEDKKDYLLIDAQNNKEFLVKTIDFDSGLAVGDFITAKIVKKLEGNYFFFNNVAVYSRENGLKLKKELLKSIKKIKSKPKNREAEIEWKVEYKN